VDGFIDVFPGGEVYLDEAAAFKAALGGRRSSIFSLLRPSLWKNSRRAQEKYPDMPFDLKGDGLGLGGVAIMAPGEPGDAALVHLEQTFGDIASMGEIETCIDGLVSGSRSG